jgi:hypothetical protein
LKPHTALDASSAFGNIILADVDCIPNFLETQLIDFKRFLKIGPNVSNWKQKVAKSTRSGLVVANALVFKEAFGKHGLRKA